MLRLTIFTIFCCSSLALFGQNLTGKWAGYFTPNMETLGRVYTYEMDIKELPNHQLEVVTYTKFSVDFSAKAFADGIYTPQTNLVSINENRFENLKINNGMQGCLMSNYLVYKNIRGHDIIEGTYTSSNILNKKDCGGGTVYLEKIVSIEKQMQVEKENNAQLAKNKKSILEKNNKHQATTSIVKINQVATPKNNTQKVTKSIVTNENKSPQSSKRIIVKTINYTENAIVKNKVNPTPKITTPNSNLNKQESKQPTLSASTASAPSTSSVTKTTNEAPNSATVTTNAPLPKNSNTIQNNTASSVTNDNENDLSGSSNDKPENTLQNIPWVLVSRENKLIKTIKIASQKFTIDFYDNGTIDNDTVMVFDNKQLAVNKQRLSYKAIHTEFSFTNKLTEHEIIIVAHNMGQVPPNTALLVLRDGNTRQELFITSTIKVNAKLIFQYAPPH